VQEEMLLAAEGNASQPRTDSDATTILTPSPPRLPLRVPDGYRPVNREPFKLKNVEK
jgi:hypothetical protein